MNPATTVLIVALATVDGAVAGRGARLLLGRLRRGARVPPPWCELAVAAVWGLGTAAVLLGGADVGWLPLVLGTGWLLVACGAVDVVHRRLPDALTVPAAPAVLLLLVPLGPGTVLRAACGAAVLLGAHAAVHLLAPRSLGAGDVKLAAPVGAVLAAVSWPAVLLGTVLAALTSAALALILGRRPDHRGVDPRGPDGRRGAVPHGPSMLGASWAVLALAAGSAGAG
ncbi:MAG: prepilin peptidase [Pseudonocardia sp.]|nr:prepilin peptidase [Pseudonocardia sp.]